MILIVLIVEVLLEILIIWMIHKFKIFIVLFGHDMNLSLTTQIIGFFK